MEQFGGRVVILGFGTIGQCILPMLLDTLSLPGERYLVIDGDEHNAAIAPFRERNIDYQIHRIYADNLAATLEALLSAGDLFINLSVGVSSIALADWCHHQDVVYVDTAIEPWEETNWGINLPPHQRTEYLHHQQARELAAAQWRADGATVVYTHGANPGLVNHFVKAALLDVAAAMDLEVDTPTTREQWAALAQRTGTQVIHVSERDTQVSTEPKRVGEFVNTWSIPGFIEEATMPVEIGWGTHEKTLPPNARQHPVGLKHTVYLLQSGAQLLLRSWVPLGGSIAGFALPHSETITLTDYLTVYAGEQVSYRPTVVFVYLPCDAALASLHESMMNEWREPQRKRVMNADITEGRDELGVLLLGHGRGGWWYGSQLDIHEGRKLVPGHNPTAIQVAAGALAAAVWAMENPHRGFCEPEALPHEEILALARPYLGPMVSAATDWTPLTDRLPLFDEPHMDTADPWQFTNFLVRG